MLIKSRVLGEAIAGAETTMRYLTLRRDIAGWTLRLRGENYLGETVWQKQMSFEDFLNLKDRSWVIVVSPETNELR